MPRVQVFDTPELLAQAAAEFIVELARSKTPQDFFNLVLSGGHTPRRVYELLATAEFKTQINWPKVQIFFGDERTVPPEHPASNYGMASLTLLSKVPIPDSNIHPIAGEGAPDTNPQSYERELKSVFIGSPWPRFDLVLLGMGEDGHTASLFPGTAAVHEEKAWVAANWVPSLEEFRITLTLPAINAASNILFLVTGEKKAVMVAEVLAGSSRSEKLPAQLIKAKDGSVTWMIDKAAAALYELRISRLE